jgi:ArsR family transcriptional regulator
MFKRIFRPMEIQCKQFFQLLSDDTRLRSLLLMQQQGELCVCELVHALGEIQPKISRHLAALREAGIVIDRRQGQWIYYQINPDLPSWARQVLDATIKEAKKQEPYLNDHAALAEMPNRPSAACCA